MNDLLAKIFVRPAIDSTDRIDLDRLAALVGVEVLDDRFFMLGEFEVEVSSNPDSPSRSTLQTPDWMSFPIFVEVFVEESAKLDGRQVIETLSRLVAALDQADASYVTASDFENGLPRQGRSVDIGPSDF